MRLYLNPRSGASRSVLMFYHEHERMAASCEVELASRHHGADRSADFAHAVAAPVLTDSDLVLRQPPAILRYLADYYTSPAYKVMKRPRARIDAAMDWVHSELARDLCHGYLYPQLLSSHRYSNARTQADVVARGHVLAAARLKQFDTHLRVNGSAYLCGDQISIADYSAAGVIGFADASGLRLADWPRVSSWLRLMKSRPSWAPTHFAIRSQGFRRGWLSCAARAV